MGETYCPKSVDDVQVGPIFPPYQLDTFQHCPKHWDLAKRWTPKRDVLYTATLIGSAIAYGLERFYLGSDCPELEADGYVAQHYRQDYGSRADRTEAGCRKLVEKGVNLGMDTDFGAQDVLGVEKFFGRVRPDLVIRDKADQLVVIDHKVKMSLDDRYVEKELQGYNTSNQFFHYAWAVGQDYGEPVDRVLAHMLILAPNPRVIVHPVKIDQEHLAMWLRGAAWDWKTMDAVGKGYEAQRRFTACQTKYGPCEMYDACHTFYGDESQFEALYDRVGRGK